MISSVLIIGGGVMGEGMARQLVMHNTVAAQSMLIVDHNEAKAAALSESINIPVATTLPKGELHRFAVIILAVKPQDAVSVLKQLKAEPLGNQLVISIMAGLSLASLSKSLAYHRVVHAMPNLPITIGQGVIAWCADAGCSETDRQLVQQLFLGMGSVIEIAEEHLNAVTAISGSGPGYFYAFADHFMQAAAALGIDKVITQELVKATLLGASALYGESDLSPAELKSKVTSKNGTTEAALTVIEQRKVAEAWQEALKIAKQRAGEMAQSLDISDELA